MGVGATRDQGLGKGRSARAAAGRPGEESGKLREGEGEGRGAGAKRGEHARRGSTSQLKTASQLLANQLLNSIHCRVGTKKWLFIRILVWYCSAPHKRRFIMWKDPPFSREKQ